MNMQRSAIMHAGRGAIRRIAPLGGIAFLALVVVGCGFQLRGAQQVDPALSPLAVESVDMGSALLPPLRRALVDAGAELARGARTPVATLRIVEDSMGERISAVSAQGRPREMELSYRVAFELHGPDGSLVERRSLVLTREFAVDERTVLAQGREAEVLRAGLVRDMVVALVRQVAAVRTQ